MDTKPCIECGATITRAAGQRDYMWTSKRTCSEPCRIAQLLKGTYYLRAIHKTTGALWYLRTSYNHRTTASYEYVVVSADKAQELSSGTGKGGRLTSEWEAR